MIDAQPTWIITAQVSRMESLGGGLRAKGEEGSAAAVLIAVAIGVALLALAWFLLARFTDIGRSRINSPRKLFAELCAAHQLDKPSCKLLKQVTRWQRLEHPARIFLEPERFDEVNLSPNLRASQPQLETLRARLFSLPATKPAEGEAAAGQAET